MRVPDNIDRLEFKKVIKEILLIKKVADDTLEIISKQRIKVYEETEEEIRKTMQKVFHLRAEAEKKLENLICESNSYLDNDNMLKRKILNKKIKDSLLEKKKIYLETQNVLDKVNNNIESERAFLNAKFERTLEYKNKVYKEILEKAKGVSSIFYQSVKEELEFNY
ncbi:hypothetical protein [Candidatus Tisiphia endosymbiont of Ptychoptera albimana]|uniref:hypothetical protein n=1 Tax=Candidatus Tisiphia endosymbiont of Ptychoptera albimana TaxID=3066260 RepID=UPI00312C93E5